MKKQKRAFSLNPFRKRYLGNIGCELFHTSDKAIVITASIAGYHGMPTCPSYSSKQSLRKSLGRSVENVA